MWYRPGYGPELDSLRQAIRKYRPGALPVPGQTSDRTRLFRKPVVASSWFAVAIVDTLLQFAAKVRLLRSRGEVVICDRYVEDALIDLSLSFPEIVERHRNALSVLTYLCPRPNLQILLLLEESEAIDRAARKREPFPDAESVRKMRYQAYSKLARRSSFLVVDGGAPIGEVADSILNALSGAGVLDERP